MPALGLNVLLFAIYVAASSVGLLLIKGAMSRLGVTAGALFTPSLDLFWLVSGFGLYVISFVVWIRILARLPLSTAYPIAIGLTLACSTAGAVLILGERLGAIKLFGILFIFAGCVALSMESR